MRYFALLGLLSAGAYAVLVVGLSWALVVAWPRCRRALAHVPAAQRAQWLAALRLAPAAVGVMGALTLASIFVRFEPRDTRETPGLLLLAFAAGGGALFCHTGFRTMQAVRAGRECVRLLRSCGRELEGVRPLPLWVVESPYPIAAVTGILRPRLLISSGILRACPPEEMEAILRHETAHVRRRDNLLRALMMTVPDALQFGRTGQDVQAAWAASAEEAADDEAAGDALDARSDLAAALVRVARMADGPPPDWITGVAFFTGTNLEDRVHRLLNRGSDGVPAPVLAVGSILLVAASVAIAAADTVALRVHTVMETAVNFLP
jgi:Zn-dependent protease with chaperone function